MHSLIASYLETIINPNTLRAYKRIWEQYEARFGDNITQETIDGYIVYLTYACNTKSSLNQAINAVNSGLNYAKERGLVVAKAKTHKINPSISKTYISLDLRQQVKRYLANLPHGTETEKFTKYRDNLLNNLIYHGLRAEEICNLNNDDIDLRRANFVIHIKGKGDKPRVIVASNDLKMAIDDYINFVSAETRTLEVPHNDDDPLILNLRMQRITPNGITHLIKKWYGSDYSPHDFRATLATDLFDKGFTVLDVMSWFGWSKPETAMHYNLKQHERLGLISETI